MPSRSVWTSLVATVGVFLVGAHTALGANWGSFQADFCRGTDGISIAQNGNPLPPEAPQQFFRQYSAILWNIAGSDWTTACKNQPADIAGYHFSGATRCVVNTGHMWGEFNVPDTGCARDIDALATSPLIDLSPRPYYCTPLMLVEAWQTDGCSNDLVDSTTKRYKDVFYDQCILHDYCYATPWTKMGTGGNPREFCDATFLNHSGIETWFWYVQNNGAASYNAAQAWATTNCTVFTWTGLAGAAHDIGVGANGTVWVIGTNPVPGGYGIYRWISTGWAVIGGGAVAIDVTADGRAWIINDNQDIFEWINDTVGWKYHAGKKARDIGVGGSVWIISNEPGPGGYKIYQGSNQMGTMTWTARGGNAMAIDVTADGRAWIVNNNHDIFEWINNPLGWKYHGGEKARAIGVGADGGVWIISNEPMAGGNYRIRRQVDGGWATITGAGTKVSGGATNPWILVGIVNAAGGIVLGRTP